MSTEALSAKVDLSMSKTCAIRLGPRPRERHRSLSASR